MQETLYNHLIRIVYHKISFNYGAEMETCARITQKPLTNEYQYGWYHADLVPYILDYIQCQQHNQLIHHVTSELVDIVNNDNSYTNTKTTSHAYSFMKAQCNRLLRKFDFKS